MSGRPIKRTLRGHAGKQAPGHGGRPQAAERAGNFDHTCAPARQPARQRLTRRENFTCAELAMTPVKCHSQLTQCAYIGLAGGSAPSTPGRRYGACAAPVQNPPSRRPLSGRAFGWVMSAGRPPASGSAPSARAVPAGSPADHALCARLRRSWRRAAPGIPHRLA